MRNCLLHITAVHDFWCPGIDFGKVGNYVAGTQKNESSSPEFKFTTLISFPFYTEH